MGWRCGPERITCGNVGGLGEVLRETLNAVCRGNGGLFNVEQPPVLFNYKVNRPGCNIIKENVTGGARLFCL